MKIASITNYQNNHYIPLKNKSDWKIQKKDEGVFIPKKRYKFEKICGYILGGLMIVDIIRLLGKSNRPM